MSNYTASFPEIASADIGRVGGKGANLGELTAAGFTVPPGFCVTTDAYDEFAATAIADIETLLVDVGPGDLDHLSAAAGKVRAILDALPVPAAVDTAVTEAWQSLGPDGALAVRSSATAEDLPTASFAGQQDTFLNVRGHDDLIDKMKACWISLFTDRAVLYRVQQGIDHSIVSLCVVVQQMVSSEVSGILFTADPVSGRRNIISIDSGFGLGIDRAVVVGHSAGGFATVILAAEHPDRFRGAVLTGHGLSFDWGQLVPAVPGIGDIWALRQSIIGPAFSEKYREQAEAVHRIRGTRRAYLTFVSNQYRFASLDYLNVWDEVEIPVLQMHGVDDTSIPIGAGRDISSRIADSRFVAIDDSDHFIHIDAPDQWIDEVTSFVEALPE